MTQLDLSQAQECTQEIAEPKTICWCCMKPAESSSRDMFPPMKGSKTIYLLGDCCKELSTEVIHRAV